MGDWVIGWRFGIGDWRFIGDCGRARPLVVRLNGRFDRVEDFSRQLLRDAFADGAAFNQYGVVQGLNRHVPSVACDAFGPVFKGGWLALLGGLPSRGQGGGDRRAVDENSYGGDLGFV